MLSYNKKVFVANKDILMRKIITCDKDIITYSNIISNTIYSYDFHFTCGCISLWHRFVT